MFKIIDGINPEKFIIGVLRNIENNISKNERTSTKNWCLVQNYLLKSTSKGGMNSSIKQCVLLGIDPDAYSFYTMLDSEIINQNEFIDRKLKIKLQNLVIRHINILNDNNVLITIDRMAFGFKWSLSKGDSGSDLGYSECYGNNVEIGSFIDYVDALEDAINIIEKLSLKDYMKLPSANLSHYGSYLNNNFR